MHPTAQSLLEAQLVFLDHALQSDNLRAHLEHEANTYCKLLETIPFKDFLPEETTIGWTQRNILGYQPTEGMRQQLLMLVEFGLDNVSSQNIPLRDLISRQIYDMMVDRLISRPELRQEIIEMVLHNPKSHRMLSDLLYRNLIGYVTTHNPVAKHVPGAASLIKLGSDAISRFSGIERTLQRSVKAYIRHTLRDSASFGVNLVITALSNEQLRHYADEFWPRLANYRLGDASRHLELEGYSYLLVMFWNMMRNTDFIRNQVAFIIHNWYQQKGNEMAMSLLEDIGITQAQIVREVVAIGTPIISTLHKSNHITNRVRHHLSAFYETTEAHNILNQVNETQS